MAYSEDLLKDLYRTMVRIRVCEESLVEPIRCREIKTPCHLYSGQEAVAAGISANLHLKDYVFGNHRSHGHFLGKGGTPKEMLAEIFCREEGCSRGRGGSMHLISPDRGMMGSAPIVAGTISLALGTALASAIRQDDRVTVSFFGDGATGEGVLYESLNFAGLRKLPIIFACENNLYATHMPIRECRVNQDIFSIAEPFRIAAKQVDGNNVLDVYEAGKWAVECCRNGDGPIFLEFLTYRFRGHVGPDDNIQGCHTDIRPKEEIERWFEKDPIKDFENFLIANKLIDAPILQSIKKEVDEEVAEALGFARESASPNPEELEKNIFAVY